MFETGEGGERVLKYLVRRFARQLGNKANAAGVKIEPRIDQAAVDIGR